MTPKQQRFIDAYLLEPNATKAALAAGYSPNNPSEIGSQVLRKTTDVIQAKLAEASVKAELTLDSHIATLAELRDEARQLEQIGAAITAETNRGKAAGLYIERTESRSTELHIIRIDG